MEKYSQENQIEEKGHIMVVMSGTFVDEGINNYVINNALEWKKRGYRVTAICQDRQAKEYPFVDSYIEGFFPANAPKLKSGQFRVVVPDVNGIIPIYTNSQHCEFPGVHTKLVQQMTEQQIQTNIEMSVNCVRAVVMHDRPFKVISKYIILSGIVCYKALDELNIPYDLLVLGSALQYSIKPYPHLWQWVLPAYKKVSTIYCRTQFVKNEILKCFKNYVEEFVLDKKIKVIQPGMNPDIIKIPQSYQKCEKQFLYNVAGDLKKLFKQKLIEMQDKKIPFSEVSADQLHDLLVEKGKRDNKNSIQEDLLEKWIKYSEEDETIIYTGSLIKNKGVGELLGIAPKLISRRPTLKFIFSGTGPYKEHMLHLLDAFEKGDLPKAKLIAQAGEFITQINIEDHFIKIEKVIRDRIIFTGLLEPQELLSLLPLCTIYACPSRTLESHCMRIIEAMCCGLTPICNDHSWNEEVLDVIEKAYPELSRIIRVDRSQFFTKLPETILATLNFLKKSSLPKQQYRQKLRKIAVDNFSWQHIAQVLVETEERQKSITNTKQRKFEINSQSIEVKNQRKLML